MSYADGAFAAAMALGMVIHDCDKVFPVIQGASLGIFGLVEGTKTAPYI